MKTESVLNDRSWIRFNKPLISPEAIGLKKALAVLLMAISTLAAFAQGKVSLQLDGGCAITFSTDITRLYAADYGLAGQPVPTTGPLPSGFQLVVGLYGGTSSTSLSLQGSTILNPVGGTGEPPGVILAHNILLTGIPGASGRQYFQVRIWNASYASYEAAQGQPGYLAENNMFTMTPGTFTYNSITTGGGTTWAAVGNETPFILPGLGGGCGCEYYVYIDFQPGNQTVVRGGTATFAVAAHPACYCVPLSYQWRFNGVPIPGATSSLYQITNAQPANAGHYGVYISDFYYGTSSSDATLTVLPVPPAITLPPQSQTAEVGANVGFRVGAAGDPPLVYQWFFIASHAVSGATTNSPLQLTNVQFSQAGPYTVVVTNVGGAVTSPPAMLNVITPVERRPVPALTLMGQSGDLLNLDYASALAPAPNWVSLDTVVLTNAAQWYFDAAAPLASERFYRTWDTNVLSPPSALDLHMVPGITLTGALGSSVRVDYINQLGPVGAWVTLDTVRLTSSPQLYFDVSSIGQPPRLYRLVPMP